MAFICHVIFVRKSTAGGLAQPGWDVLKTEVLVSLYNNNAETTKIYVNIISKTIAFSKADDFLVIQLYLYSKGGITQAM